MALTPQLAVVKFKESGRNVTFVSPVEDIKDFKPLSYEDFVRDKEYDVKWQKSDLEFDGFYKAHILCLGATIDEIDAKVRKNKWKTPINLSALMPNKQRDTKPTKQAPLKPSESRKSLRTVRMAGDLSRMEQVLNLVETPEVKKELVNCDTNKEDSDLDTTQANSDSDSDDIAMKLVELQRDYDKLKSKFVKLEQKYEDISQLHSSCPAAISLADSRWKSCKAEFEDYKLKSQQKIREIASLNIKLQLELKKSPATKSQIISSTPIKDSENSGTFPDSDLSADNSLEKAPKVKRERKVSSDDQLEELNDIANRVCKDIQGTERLPESNGKVILDGSLGINSTFWKKKLRTADTDSQFINKFPPALWSPGEMKDRRLHGGMKDSNCKVATPAKVKVILGSFEGRLRAAGVGEDAAKLRRLGAKKTLERKFIDFSRKKKEKAPEEGSNQD